PRRRSARRDRVPFSEPARRSPGIGPGRRWTCPWQARPERCAAPGSGRSESSRPRVVGGRSPPPTPTDGSFFGPGRPSSGRGPGTGEWPTSPLPNDRPGSGTTPTTERFSGQLTHLRNSWLDPHQHRGNPSPSPNGPFPGPDRPPPIVAIDPRRIRPHRTVGTPPPRTTAPHPPDPVTATPSTETATTTTPGPVRTGRTALP